MPSDDLPEVFLKSQNQPTPRTPLTDLLVGGHFRRAAETSLDELLKCSPNDATRVFQLLYTRLACLVLVSKADLASHEATPLTAFLARNPPEASDIIPLIPWELRLLIVRLQSITVADGGRRGIMSLYALAAEVRSNFQTANDARSTSEISRWSSRLHDLGLRVVDTLVEMGELETATRHLDTLVDVDQDELAYRKALLRLRVGDIAGAKRCVDKVQDALRRSSLRAVLNVAQGDFSKALDEWQQLAETYSGNGFVATNMAISLLYTGQISQARDVFEELAQRSSAFPALLFNLGTVYELCTEQSAERKTTLAQRMAAKVPTPDSGGWERATFEFKL